MGRIIGLIGCSCLVIAAMRMANLSHSDSATLKGGEERAAAQKKLSPRDHFKRGKELYLRGKYFEALPHLEEASLAKTGLTAADRRQADEILKRARGKVQALSTNDTSDEVVRGQSEDLNEHDSEDDASSAARDRVTQLMLQAKAAHKNGDTTEAIKLARLASRLAKDAKLKFSTKEMTPGEFLAKITPVKPNLVGNTAAGAGNEWTNAERSNARDSELTQASASDDDNGGIQQAGGFDDEEPKVRMAPTNRRAVSGKEQAKLLLAKAREDIKAGRYDDARRRALEANELGVSYKVLDEDRPDMVLAEIDRLTGKTTMLRKKGSDITVAGAFGDDDGNKVEQAGDSNNADQAKKQRALELLKQARIELKAGKLEAAQAKAEQAQQLKVTYSLWEDMPEVVMNEIEERRSVEGAARQRGGAGKAGDTVQAKALLAKAKKALKEGKFEEARAMAAQADQMKVAFSLLDETPEIVLEQIAKAEAKGLNSKSSGASGATNVAAMQAEAVGMLRQARQLMKDKKFEEARLKALQVQSMDVKLSTKDDSPALVLSDLDKAETLAARNQDAGNDIKTVSNQELTSNNVTAAAPSRGGSRPKGRATQAAETTEVVEFSTSGMSATQMYNMGMAELKKGHREVAYKAFKAAYDSGQRLDPVIAQRLNVYLRELSPRNGIQLASSEVDAKESTPLDAAQQEQLVKFERLREEVINSVYKAERMKDSDPEKALELIDQTLAKVEGAELATEASGPLMKQLNRSRASLRSEIEQQQPNIEMNAENKRVKDRIKGDIENSVRIDQELVKLTEQYNDMMHQQRYADAEVIAKQAEMLNPKEPTVVMMKLKAQFARQDKFIKDLKNDKDATRLRVGNELERSLVHNVGDDHPMDFDKKAWEKANARVGKYGADNRTRSDEEIQIEKSLQKRISLHETNAPLGEVILKIKSLADINIVIDDVGLEEVGVTSSTPVSIDVDMIMVKSALNLILKRFDLGYMYADETLNITSSNRQKGNLEPRVYNVTDLVIPIPNFGVNGGDGSFSMAPPNSTENHGFGPQAYLNPGFAGQAFAQVGPNGNGFAAVPPNRGGNDGRTYQTPRTADFGPLTELLTTTVSPDSWEQGGGEATVRAFPGTLSLVIRQTQKVHEEIHDLLEQLRRLQDLQVTVEVRFVTVADRFFERIGIDFNFNVKPTTGYQKIDNAGLPIPAFGSVQLPQSGIFGGGSTSGSTSGGTSGGQSGGTSTGGQGGTSGGQSGGQAGTSGGQAGTSGGTSGAPIGSLFALPPSLSLYNNPQNTSIVGLQNSTTFTPDLTVPFQQGSFNVGVPQFGGYNPAAGVQTGIAILSDLEAFFFIQAAQGDQRTNLMFAPKVTMFNGQFATVSDTKARPFVQSLIPTVGIGAVGYTPIVTTVNEGVTLSAQAVISADRRFVRLTLTPFFTSITDVFTYQATGSGAGGGGGGQGGQGGGAGGFGGGQFGGGGGGGQQGGGGQGGQLGIGGGLGSMQIMQALFTQQVGGQQGGGGGVGGGQQGGGGGQQGQAGGQQGQQGGGQILTVQQPVVERVTLSTTVSVPDGGTVLLGGIKRLKEGRTMSGVPILNKIPYVSRLFKNSGVGRETESLMMMVTPRIIIQEEEESLLGQATR